MYKTTAKVQVKNSKGEVILSQEYEKLVFEGTGPDDKGKPTGGEPLELLQAGIDFLQEKVGKAGNGVVELLGYVTYAYDLEARAKIRNALVSNAAGPEKAIEKQIKEYMAARAAMGRPVSEEIARKRVMAMLEEE
jgi:hypothetical protein